MAVYTQVSEAALAEFLRDYDLANPTQFQAITAGVQNSNYLLEINETRYILTLYEDKENGVNPDDLPFFLELMQHLGQRDFPSPTPVPRNDGALFGTLCNRPAALTSFLKGQSSKSPKPDHCQKVGEAMATLHIKTQDFSLRRDNRHTLADWMRMFEICRSGANDVVPNLEGEIETELHRLQTHWRQDLPQGIIHADLFPDNVFFRERQLSGVIDFYFACTDAYAYDLAIALNAWCFESDATFNITKARALMHGYQAVRPLMTTEIEALPILAAGAAMRFLLTRLYDWQTQEKDALVTLKNPRDYLRRLRFHKNVKSATDYGINV